MHMTATCRLVIRCGRPDALPSRQLVQLSRVRQSGEGGPPSRRCSADPSHSFCNDARRRRIAPGPVRSPGYSPIAVFSRHERRRLYVLHPRASGYPAHRHALSRAARLASQAGIEHGACRRAPVVFSRQQLSDEVRPPLRAALASARRVLNALGGHHLHAEESQRSRHDLDAETVRVVPQHRRLQYEERLSLGRRLSGPRHRRREGERRADPSAHVQPSRLSGSSRAPTSA